jgi:D-sedoheptulose 7-phosphate isomerase
VSGAHVASALDRLAALVAACKALGPEIERVAARYVEALRGGGTLFFCGNGGSAADAQHLAT